MAKYRIFYWKHIPSSITVEGDGKTIKKQLSQKIQNAIDSYAMAEGLTGTLKSALPGRSACEEPAVGAVRAWTAAIPSGGGYG